MEISIPILEHTHYEEFSPYTEMKSLAESCLLPLVLPFSID